MKRSAANRYAIATALRTARALERPCPTMTTPGDAEQRRAAVFRIVDAAAEMPERAPRQQRSDPHRERARKLLAQQLLNRVHQAFADLQRHVAREPVAHDDVCLTAVHVARLDVADELDRRRLEQPVRLARELVALVSSSPIDSSPTRGDDMPSPTRAYTLPITANCSRCCGRHSSWRRRRAARRDDAASESSQPAPDDRRRATCRTRRARP